MLKNILSKKITTFLLILLPSVLFSQTTITSVTTGNWNDTATWVGGVVPVSGDNVIIAAGHTVTLVANTDISSGNLTLTGTIALAGFNLTAGSLAGAGNIGTSSGTPLVTVGSNGSNTTYSGVYSGTGARLTKEGSGTLTLSGVNSYTGATVINAGTLRLGVAERISNSSALTIATGAVFDMNGFSETVFSFEGGGTITSNAVGSVTITYNGPFATTTFSGVIQNGSGTVSLNMPLSNTLTLTGNNTYTGATSVSNGLIYIGNGGTSGSVAGNITIGSAGNVFFNRSDDFTFSGNISGGGMSVFKQGAGTMTLTGNITGISSVAVQGGNLSIGNGGTSGSVSVNINNTATVVFNRSDNITYSNVISNSGTITKLGAGTLTLSGVNTNTGAFNVNVGTVQISTNERLGNCNLTVASGATFNLNGFSETIASIAGAGTITSSAVGAVTLTNGGTTTTTFSGVIQNGSGTLSLTKSGTGTLTLSSANTYTGTTSISAGTLIVGNATALSSSIITLSSTGILRTDVPATFNRLTVSTLTAKVNCNGNNSTCTRLIFLTATQPNGTHGSTASSATFKNNNFFVAASTGVITVNDCAFSLEVITTAASQTVTLPIYGTVNTTVYWGDGGSDTYTTSADWNHVYASAGTYTITIYGTMTQFGSGAAYSNAARITRMVEWGCTGLTSLNGAFWGATNLTDVPNNLPAGVTNLSNTFRNATSFNDPDVGSWNTAAVTNISGLFSGATAFNQNIGSWNTAAVTNMSGVFFEASAFNNGGSSTINNWNTSAVTTMQNVFQAATVFNQNTGSWNTGAVTNMASMFASAAAFNQNIGSWNTAAVTDMNSMFNTATAFNQNIGSWNTGAVTNMSAMLNSATAFNQNIGSWNLNANVNLGSMLNSSGMDCSNYSATLVGWNANPTTPNGRTLGATGRTRGPQATAARANLVLATGSGGKGWTITGDTVSANSCGAFITRWNLATAGSGATQLSIGTATSGTVNYYWQQVTGGTATGSGSFSGSTLTITGLPAGAT
ncbi:BspA family leucine-rich repeat surface protein, partial [Flavobacterium sp.]|uniref:BspA family leucine-rich repeat surface protein n=1 Tax=Flavobacterium sp. TaxID=239 RepID=UPI0037BF96AB